MLTNKEIKENLKDAGCSSCEADSIMKYISSGDMKKAEKLIDASRKKQLAKLHESQKCIDRLNYLSFQLKKIMREVEVIRWMQRC